MWRFEAYADTGGSYRWRLKTSDGQPVATSGELFSSEPNARHSAAHFKAIAPSWRYEVDAETSGHYRWRAKAGNGRTMAISHDCFHSRNDAHREADNVKANAGRATGP